MSKKSKKEIEKDENKILHELLKDSSQSIDTIGKRLGFPLESCYTNINTCIHAG